VTGSGRTDAGVHALGQVAHFKTEQELDLYVFTHALNRLLPLDIRVLSIEPAVPEFHARYSAISKEYHYHLFLDPVLDPFQRHRVWQIQRSLSTELLSDACQILVGTHDFTSFSNESNRGAAAKGAVRTMKRIDMISEPGGVRLELEANGFLYKMVRNIVGTAVEVAIGKHSVEEMRDILAVRDRQQAGKTAPAQGLCLVRVGYDHSMI